jgi:diguanylate cyclase (GGDEF)-like protein/PAS domain S-box-containing protein
MEPFDDELPTLPIGLFRATPDGRIRDANPAFAQLVAAGSGLVAGSSPWANADPGDRAIAESVWRDAADAGRAVSVEFRVWQPDGRTVWVRLDASPQHDAAGAVVGYAGTGVEASKMVGQRLLLDRLVGVMDITGNAVIVFDRDGAPVFTNRAARELFGIHESMDPTRDPAVHGLMQLIRDQLPREIVQASSTTTWNGEVGFRGPDGLERTLDVDLVLRRDDEVVDYWGCVVRDVTATKQLQSELIRQANHDGLTGLPNRLLLLRTTTDALEHTRGSRRRVALLFLDIDRLKDVNDAVGHDTGDALLAQVAARISAATRPSDVVARISGDEFVVLCTGEMDEHAALELAERVRQAITGRLMVNGIEIDVTVSIGIAVSSINELDSESAHEAALALLHNSDFAMYVAKRRGRSRCELYTEAMRAESREHKVLSGQLEQALASGQLRLAYQPILSALSGRVMGAEALLRWDHPDHGTLLPAQFVHLAEESGAIAPIGDWVLRQAFQDTRAWQDAGLVDRAFSVHVNVSGRQLAEGTFVERILANIRQTELSPHQVTLDFDEATLNDNTGNLRSLQALRRFGVQLALDGFGTGTSSLTALRSCGADVLKLDGTIARTIGVTGDDDPIVRAIIQLAHALDMQVVAEWVTSADQLHRLRALGCDMVQGYLLGAPAGADAFAARATR